MKARVTFVGLLLVAFGGLPSAEEPTYIGASKCKMCHKVEYASWESLPHAKAFERLKPEEQANPECLTCHTTGNSVEFPGVQCEACHGAGSGYKSLKIMKDSEASVAAGLLQADEATCKVCHEKAPHDMPPFDFEKAKAQGIHEKKPKSS